jgi:hypothetical protein
MSNIYVAKNTKWLLGVVTYAYNPSYLEGGGRKIMGWRPDWIKLVRRYLRKKKKKNKQAEKGCRCMTQVVECLLSMGFARSSTEKKKIKII